MAALVFPLNIFKNVLHFLTVLLKNRSAKLYGFILFQNFILVFEQYFFQIWCKRGENLELFEESSPFEESST
ncbi:MAG: hypothetical protein EBU52_12975 [Cytophagia bacterium]|nr:hypothetical protein [Cytophagia bacterium]